MDETLVVKKGVVVEILEEEGEWCWCNYVRDVSLHFLIHV